jgi:hypothetical protein
MMNVFRTVFLLVLIGGCVPPTPVPSPDSGVTAAMRAACPQLSDEVLEGFVLAVEGLRANGLGEEDALQQWVDGCESIPPDGNFSGDQEACADCLRVIVLEVYRE